MRSQLEIKAREIIKENYPVDIVSIRYEYNAIFSFHLVGDIFGTVNTLDGHIHIHNIVPKT